MPPSYPSADATWVEPAPSVRSFPRDGETLPSMADVIELDSCELEFDEGIPCDVLPSPF